MSTNQTNQRKSMQNKHSLKLRKKHLILFCVLLLVGLFILSCAAEQGSYKSNDSDPGLLPMLNVVAPTKSPSEGGGDNVSFTIALNTRPGGDVSVALSTDNSSLGTVSPSTLTFTDSNWNSPQTASITGGGCDNDSTTNPSYTVSATPSGTNYSGQAASTFSVTNTTIPWFYVGNVSGTTSETGDNASLTVVLCTAPTLDVSIPLKSSDTSQVTISTTSLTFSSGNWSTPQTVTLLGQDDIIVDDNRSIAITLGASTSFDSTYNGLAAQTRTVINVDNETPDFVITKSITTDNTTLDNTTEIGGSATFNVALDFEPLSDVIIPISTSDSTEGSSLVTTLRFTTTNWMTNQTVTVTGTDDFIDDDNVSYNIVVGSPTSGPLAYTNLSSKTLTSINIDNDTAGFLVGASTPDNGTTDLGHTATIPVSLLTEPTADVTFTVSSSDTTNGGTVSPSSLTFTSANWNTSQTITVTGALGIAGNTNYTVTFGAATSTDAKYSGLTPTSKTLTNVNL